ncbi:hypothetical protein POX_d05826 [Penicillium oxalicum]|uniref:Uncharacterized protein n=1 Tax=Penicillium oxalicum (strain 114-2 / CGMCC 5302) TaxID=933388 RepID=S8AZW2_PENO1|nr:hypothetical protein POX_d05826 [Penicillium oxalicum]EPS31998.1 hypothetical protein PDE_06957 [Penicillium oxalicum 114-2]KAI2790316.1 hypothetical protein POX_d05826 [Penicillium oxalicum]
MEPTWRLGAARARYILIEVMVLIVVSLHRLSPYSLTLDKVMEMGDNEISIAIGAISGSLQSSPSQSSSRSQEFQKLWSPERRVSSHAQWQPVPAQQRHVTE